MKVNSENQSKPLPKEIKGLSVFLESRKTRLYVGELHRGSAKKKQDNQNNKGQFEFEYDSGYLRSKNSIPLGPDLPLTKKIHKSEGIFKSLQDRIPTRRNPSYKDYCIQMGISPEERDPIVLLATIGRRGPSSFVFEPIYENDFNAEKLKEFRSSLGLTIREFASAFDFSPATVLRIENKKGTGKESLKRIQIYYEFPDVALRELKRNGGRIHEKKQQLAIDALMGFKPKQSTG